MRWEAIWFITCIATTNAAVHTIDNKVIPNDIQQMHEDDNLLEPPVDNNPTTFVDVDNGTFTEGTTAAVNETTIYNTTLNPEHAVTTAAMISIATTNPTLNYENNTEGGSNVTIYNPETESVTVGTQKTTDTDPTETGTTATTTTATVTTTEVTIETQPDLDQPARSNEVLPGNSNEESEPVGNENPTTIVNTTNGPVQGFEWNETASIISYIDVQYGEFTGYFQDPTPSRSREHIHQVREHSKRCPQLQDGIYIGDLDCLTLSIFKPLNATNSSVLFHIHDSKFTSGSGNPAIYGPDYFVSKGVILVLPNYRIGPLGFLCLDNETAPGNAALKDLTLALHWTVENIDRFGGNPTNIVISGDGTSGALAGYLALSPKSRNFISKVITETGSVLSHWALDRNPDITAENLAKLIRDEGTLYNNTFQEADLETIVRASKNIGFKPCIEQNNNPFMINTPWEILHKQEINTIFMIGTANYAGANEALNIIEANIEELNDDFGQFLPEDLKFKSCEEKEHVGNQVRKQYFGETNISMEHVDELSLCFTDAYYLGSAIRTARPLVQAGAPVYLYEFAFVGELNRELISMNKPVNGAVRGDIVGYLFTQDGTIPDEDTQEKHMVDLMIDLWISFIEEGKPKAADIVWNSLNKTKEANEEEWLSIGAEVELKRGLHVDRLSLWTDIYNQHFIEHNHANRRLPYIYVVFTLLLFWTGFCKHVYHL